MAFSVSGLESRPRSTLEIVPAESPAWAATGRKERRTAKKVAKKRRA
jgi:hypothetical protein